MSSVFVSSQDVLAASSALSALNHEVSNCFAMMKSDVQNMEAIWQSPAAQVYQEKFRQLSPTFEAACQKLESLSAYLHQTALNYQENEGALSMNGV